jgi:sigma-B regulation protein RsbU (phosphoserine phosphatase)
VTKLAFFYQTRTFIVLVVSCIAGLLYGIYVMRVRQLRQRNLEEQEQKERLRELELTSAVQTMLLPKSTTFNSDKVKISGFYRPATACGGDWWWYVALGERVYLIMGDVTGHGAPAAMVTAAVAASFRTMRSEHAHLDVPSMMTTIHQNLEAFCAGKYAMSMLALEVNARSGEAHLWSAGAPIPLIDQGQSVSSIALRGGPLGSSEFTLGKASYNFAPGHRLLMFTDGLPELAVPGGKQLGVKRIAKLLAQTRTIDLDKAIAFFGTSIDDARQNEIQGDDITFALVDFTG